MPMKYRTVVKKGGRPEANGDEQPRARCPECGAVIPLIGTRWLAAHREGVVEYSYRPGSGARCPGSLLLTPTPGAALA
jgi:hypothetical protein